MFKKIFYTLFCAFLLFLLLVQTHLAANNVSDINVDVTINDDGSAYISQTWNCDFINGTEGYIPIQNLGKMNITDFSVSDVDGEYMYINDWNIDASFEEKTGKYGMVETDEGYELCWGISKYGKRHYVILYKLDNFIGAYEDFDGFNFQFINSGMKTLPTDVTVKIMMQNGTKLDKNNSKIWAFGFDGEINFEDGQVVAFTKNPLSSSSDSVIIMMQFNKGLTNPSRVVDKSFEKIKSEAFEGSDYDYRDIRKNTSEIPVEEASIIDLLIGMIIVFSPIVLAVYFVLKKIKQKRKMLNLYKNADYFREAPIAGNLEATFVLARKFKQIKDDGNLIGGAFLKLINTKCLEPITEKKVGLFGKEKEEISLKLVHPPEYAGITTNKLYDLLVLASSADQILQENELKNYCYKNHGAIMEIIEKSKKEGKQKLAQIDSYDISKKGFMGLSMKGKSLLLEIMGFKKYLLEFSLIDERTISQSIIWQEYLIFATLLGIADKVIEQFTKVYPNVAEYSKNTHYYYLIARRYNKASYGAAQSARSNGSGGRSSFRSLGGFSGGGSGGGTR